MRALCRRSKTASPGNTAALATSIKSWECIHIDVAGPHLGRHFLIVKNAYLKYPDVISVSSTTSQQTLEILRKLCAQHGVLEINVSANGMSFISHEFREFCKSNTISHILSPPYLPPIKWTSPTHFRNFQARPTQTDRGGRCG